MHRKYVILTACSVFLWCSAATRGAEVLPGSSVPAETKEQRDARMAWWREARFGMFIHWGVYSVPAGTWKGEQITRSGGEWIMNRGRIPVAEYQKLPAQFNPVKFDADEWVRLAKGAGMKYIVVTAKHHDGFAMYHSQVDPFNVYDASPFKRDPLAELARACRQQGIKLGIYYSQSQDWNHRGGSTAGGQWDPAAQNGNMDDYLDKIAVPQLRELLTNYGPLAVLWWDTPIGMTPERAAKFLPVLKLQPALITNNRLASTKTGGDFQTPENKIPATGIPDKDWEACMTMNGTWGYRSFSDKWKSGETLLRNLIEIASKGGNYLLNVGPTSEGVIPAPSVERLQAIGAWMQVNGVAIYGTTASPFASLPWGRCTKKVMPDGVTLYLHVFDWPKDGRLVVPGLKSRVRSARLLADGRPLDTTPTPTGLTVILPALAPDAVSSTVVLSVQGPLVVK